MEHFDVTLDQLSDLIEKKDVTSIRELFDQYNIVDMSELVGELSFPHALFLFKTLKKDTSSLVFTYLPYDKQERLIEAFTAPEIKEIVDNLYSDDILDFIEEMPANVVQHILYNVSPQKRAEINKLLSYEENSAGSIMTTAFVSFKVSDTVSEAIHKIRTKGQKAETINICYVTDAKRVLLGCITLRRLLLAQPDEIIENVMEDEVIYASTHEDQEEVARLIQKYDITMVPVVNDEKCLVGIITVDDIIDIIHEEATEDIHKMNAIAPLEKTYLETGVFEMSRSRIIWLLVLMISATFTGGIISHYEHILSQYVVLAVFIPMLMDAAGNAGSQSSTMIIRALAIGEICLKDFVKVWFKEARVALICGFIMACVNFLRIIIFSSDEVNMTLSIVVSLTLFIVVILAKLIGSTLPMIAVKINIDPAVMAGPVITTIVDALALIAYFGLVNLFFM